MTSYDVFVWHGSSGQFHMCEMAWVSNELLFQIDKGGSLYHHCIECGRDYQLAKPTVRSIFHCQWVSADGSSRSPDRTVRNKKPQIILELDTSPTIFDTIGNFKDITL